MTSRRVRDHNAFKWLYPGMHIKRWLVLLFFGIAILGLGAAIFIRDLYRTNAADEIPIVFWLTGAWLEPQIRAGLVAVGPGVVRVLGLPNASYVNRVSSQRAAPAPERESSQSRRTETWPRS